MSSAKMMTATLQKQLFNSTVCSAISGKSPSELSKVSNSQTISEKPLEKPFKTLKDDLPQMLKLYKVSDQLREKFARHNCKNK